ncbi:hypothetical protein BHE74_00002333 [Ensete ventricosum]|nr:hypothetical protein BHE74_00002333 [Ensete ventricosum]
MVCGLSAIGWYHQTGLFLPRYCSKSVRSIDVCSHDEAIKGSFRFNCSNVNGIQFMISYDVSASCAQLISLSSCMASVLSCFHFVSLDHNEVFILTREEEGEEEIEEEGEPRDSTPLSLDDRDLSLPSFAEMLPPPHLRRRGNDFSSFAWGEEASAMLSRLSEEERFLLPRGEKK